jgi:hypothetical protein
MRRVYEATDLAGKVHRRTTDQRVYRWAIVTTFKAGHQKVEWRRQEHEAYRAKNAAHKWAGVSCVELVPATLVKGVEPQLAVTNQAKSE